MRQLIKLIFTINNIVYHIIFKIEFWIIYSLHSLPVSSKFSPSTWQPVEDSSPFSHNDCSTLRVPESFAGDSGCIDSMGTIAGTTVFFTSTLRNFHPTPCFGWISSTIMKPSTLAIIQHFY